MITDIKILPHIKSFNHIPDISKGIVCISELSCDSVIFILSFLDNAFSNIESPHRAFRNLLGYVYMSSFLSFVTALFVFHPTDVILA